MFYRHIFIRNVRNTHFALSVVVISAAALACSSAHAGYLGLSMELHTTVSTPEGELAVYRLYAHFTEGGDRVLAWGASATFGTTTLSTGPCSSNNFFEPFGLSTAPTQAIVDVVPLAQWDTFATIGVNIADQGIPNDQTTLSVGFPAFINGNQLTMKDAIVFLPANSPQGRADFAGDGDLQLRVMLMQLTTNVDELPFGHIGLMYETAEGFKSIQTQQSWVPLEAIGRCCLPAGECIILPHSYCAQFYNGYFLGCDPCDACELTCPPDVAPHPGDGLVNVDDLIAVINAWGECQQFNPCPADVVPEPYGNGVVNVDDLIAVINAWGPCE